MRSDDDVSMRAERLVDGRRSYANCPGYSSLPHLIDKL